MTLLTTEILEGRQFLEPFIVFAADRRISLNGKPNAARKKVFRVPGYDAGVGYFGLAEVPSGQDRQPMDKWLREFLEKRPAVGGLESLATDLASALNSEIPSAWRRRYVSGIHLAGFDDGDRASFWFVRNVDDCMTPIGAYQAREDYRRRDAGGLG
ncbi:MAG: hypothetical protein OEY28_10630, partial [Nitrospira sp.]|nr:hypothetical protein [Nitrospira sp.]